MSWQDLPEGERKRLQQERSAAEALPPQDRPPGIYFDGPGPHRVVATNPIIATPGTPPGAPAFASQLHPLAAGDAVSAFTRAKMKEPGITGPLLAAVERFQREFDALSEGEKDARRRQLAAEEAAAAARFLADAEAAVADPGKALAFLDDYCHEGLQVLRADGQAVTIGLCSREESFPRADLPEAARANPYAFLTTPAADWPRPALDALRRLAEWAVGEIKGGALGC